MSAIQTVAVAGATGSIGGAILTALLRSNSFKEVRVLTRSAASGSFQAGVTVRQVDYDSVDSLKEALEGIDGVVSALSFDAIDMQKNLVLAAASAGVRRMIPSEYGNDTMNPKLASFPIYQPKIAIRELCQRQAAESGGRFSWTVVMNASFLAPGWTLDFLVDMTKRKCEIKDGGDILFCAATFDDISRAVVGIFTHPDETANRPVKISSIDTTQNELLRIAQELRPEDKWVITYSNTQDLEKQAWERWTKGDHGFEAQSMFINRAFLGKGWGGFFPEKDNKLLGIEGLSEGGLREMIREALAVKA